MGKRMLGIDVHQATQERIAWTLETFPRVYLSFSGGKDSTVMLHMAMAEAKRRERKIGVLFIDLEGQYKLTIDHVREMLTLYADSIEPYWIALPIILRNAVSQYEPRWICWEPERRADWVRPLPPEAMIEQTAFPFYRYAMEFEEFVPAFGSWYAQGRPCACMVGIRTAESLNRWRTIAGHGTKFGERGWTNYVQDDLWNIYPVYDWSTKDIWTFHGKTGLPYNRLYDRMHQAGLSIHQARICQPYGDDQRKGLWLFHLIEPETWAKIVARVNGANQGALYAQESGNVLGRIKITRPEGHTWESFAMLLLESLPPRTREHYSNKIAVFLHWWAGRGYSTIPDEADRKLEVAHKIPSWRRICWALLRNDYWCKGLSFGQQKSENYSRYLKMMKERRRRWGILDC